MIAYIVFGLPGSGKSYFASHLAKITGAEHISSDRVRKSLYPNPAYKMADKKAVYLEMMGRFERALSQLIPVVLDATFYQQAIRKEFILKARSLNADLLFVEIRASEATIKSRLQHTREDSEADFEVYQKIKRQFEPMEEEHLVLYSDELHIEAMLEQTITRVT